MSVDKVIAQIAVEIPANAEVRGVVLLLDSDVRWMIAICRPVSEAPELPYVEIAQRVQHLLASIMLDAMKPQGGVS